MGNGGKWRIFVPHVLKMVSTCRRDGRQSRKQIRELPFILSKRSRNHKFIYYRFLYMRSFVADGNFKAVHLKQKDDSSDVWLTSGEGFMTDTVRYGMHLEIAEETRTVR